jgi:adenylate cyclase
VHPPAQGVPLAGARRYHCAAMQPAARQLAILFADLSGSTSLYEKLGDRDALEAVYSVVALLKRCVAAQQGRVVKTIGDEVMAVFDDADRAARAAMAMQLEVAALPPLRDTRLAIRVGFHYGPVLEEEADYFGDGVNTAARMAGLAMGGQIMTTAAAAMQLAPELRASTREMAALPVKGKQDEVEVHELLWRTEGTITMLAVSRRPSPQRAVLRVAHGDAEFVLDASRPTLQIGRDPSHGIALRDRMASRLHGRIERRHDKFYYIDLSTNGTYVTLEPDPETTVRRDQITLQGRGTLAFGHSAAEPTAEVVRFSCEYCNQNSPGGPGR